MGASTTTADKILKEFYALGVQEQINQEAFAFETFAKATVEWQGKKAIVPVHTARNTGTGFRAEGAALPTAGSQGYKRYEIPATFMYGNFEFTGPAIESSSTDAGSYEQVMSSEMKRVSDDTRSILDKASFTGGEIIGLVWQQQSNTVWEYSGRPDSTVDTVFGVTVGAGGGNNYQARFIRLDTYASVGADTLINSITDTTLTLNAAIDTTGTPDGTVFAVLYLRDNSNENVNIGEMVGILGNLCAPIIHGVDRTTATGTAQILQTNSLVADFTAAAPVRTDLSLDALQILLDKILLASNGQPDGMVLNPVHRQSYTTLLQGSAGANVRVQVGNGAQAKADGGFKNIGYADIPFKTAQHAPKGTVFMLNRSHWHLMELAPGDFAQADGKVLNKKAGYDIYEGFWRQYANLCCTRPNAQGILTGLSYFGV